MGWIQRVYGAVRGYQITESDLRLAITTEARRTQDAEFAESLAHAELELEDTEWIRLTGEGQHAFSRSGLLRIIELSRIMFLLNPLIKQAVNLQARYVFGQGVTVSAPDEDVDKVIQEFWDYNKRVFTGHVKLTGLERTLQITGNVFIVYFHHELTGSTKLRTVPIDQMVEIITDPEDRQTPWFYLRVWQVATLGEAGMKNRKLLYPDIAYTPKDRVPALNGIEIRWDTPVHHVKVGGLEDQLFGMPETAAGIRWARLYTTQMQEWASVVSSLRIFAWQGKTKGSPGTLANRMRSSLAGSGGQETNPPPARGGIFAATAGVDLTPIKTSGASISPEDSKMIRQLVGASFGVSDPHISMDVEQGALATADNLNQPMNLKYLEGQGVWREVFETMLAWVIAKSAMSKTSILKGKGKVEVFGDRQVITLSKDLDAKVDISFPPIIEKGLGELVDAIIAAVTLNGKQPIEGLFDVPTIQRLMLSALAERNIKVDEDAVQASVQATVDEAWKIIRARAGSEVAG